jgi:hypothetical protein
MNEVELLVLGDALARASDVLRPLRPIGSLRKSGGFDCLQLDEGSIKDWDPRNNS